MAAPAQSPLRRWKRFFGAFDSVDAAIVASDPALSRNEFRQIRGDVVELLCDCDADDHRAEQLCVVLDDMMAESLETLKLVPATPAVLATADLAKSVEALRKHESERVRVLAGRVIAAWFDQSGHAKVREQALQPKEIGKHQASTAARPDAATKQSSKIPALPAKRTAATVSSDRLKTATIAAADPPLLKKTVEITKKKASVPAPAAVSIVRGDRPGLSSESEEDKFEASKRKMRDGFREVKDAKRQRGIQIIEPPKMLKQRRQKKMHPILRERSRARCASSIVKKTIVVTSQLHRI
jgi:hypothetical protein